MSELTIYYISGEIVGLQADNTSLCITVSNQSQVAINPRRALAQKLAEVARERELHKARWLGRPEARDKPPGPPTREWELDGQDF